MLVLWLLVSCSSAPEPVVAVAAQAAPDCSLAKNTCPDYAISWTATCPAGARCLEFRNSCADAVTLSYQVGCNGDGTKGAPQCDCTAGPVLAVGGSAFFEILDADYTSCLPSWKPACLTAGLAVVAGKAVIAADGAPAGAPSCQGTRVEFTAGNKADPYGKFDSYDVDLEKGYTIPVSFTPDLTCAHDTANHDCRPLWCDSATCPDAYLTPTSGGCPDGRSPQAGCQDTFNDPKSDGVGFLVEFCPASGKSCQDATPCTQNP